MNSFQSKLLKAYNLSMEDYDNMTKVLTFDDLEDPLRFLNIEKAVERIKLAIKNNEKVTIYGDYDCDGFTSTSIMVKMFKILHYNVKFYIPSRYKDGYGLSHENAVKLVQNGFKLVILVDNGISLNEEVSYLTDNGVDVLIFDHHEIGESLPNAYAIVHPFLKTDGSKLPQCAAYVCFNVSRIVLGYVDPYLMVLGGIGTLSDMMSLKSYNRTIVRLTIEAMKVNKYPQFEYLLEGKQFVDENDISFTIAPKINSLGRMIEDNNVNEGVRFLISEDINEIRRKGYLILENNRLRKSLTNSIISTLSLEDVKNDLVWVIYLPHIKEGLIGIIANKIMLEYNVPTICFTDGEEGVLKGSARTLNGFLLTDVFPCLSSFLLTSGGHALSGGLTIKKDDLEAFKIAINKLCEGRILTPNEEINIETSIDELNYENYLFLQTLRPFGQDYKEPYFIIKCPTNIIYPFKNIHIKGVLSKCLSFIGFNLSVDRHYEYGFLKGKLELNTFKNNNSLQLKISQINYKN